MRTGTNWSRKILPLLFWAVFAVACNDGVGGSDNSQRYTRIVIFGMVGDSTSAQNFVTVTNDIDLADLAGAELQLPFSERTLFPIGPIDRGDGNHNFHSAEQPDYKWNWHFIPEDWTLTDASIPLCDGNAVVVEQAIGYWVDTVGQFCPSGARVVGVRQIVFD